MDFSAFLPGWLDSLLIAPFRWVENPEAALWLGSAVLAFAVLLAGELTAAVIFICHRSRIAAMQKKVMHYHNLSVDAVHAGDKESYLAINKLAHDEFGNSFFAQASVGMGSIWPVPFALAWMSIRFEGIPVYTIPWTDLHAGYVFIFLTVYIAERILFGRVKKHLPFFSYIEGIKAEIRASCGKAKQF